MQDGSDNPQAPAQAPERTDTHSNPADDNRERDSRSPGTPIAFRPSPNRDRSNGNGRPQDNRDPNAAPRGTQRPNEVIDLDAEDGIVHEDMANTENDEKAIDVMNDESDTAAPAGKPEQARKTL